MRKTAYHLILTLFLIMFAFLPCRSQDTRTPPSEMPAGYDAFAGMKVLAVQIEFNDCSWCPAGLDNLTRDLISLSEGEEFSELKYMQSMEALRLSKRFEEPAGEVVPIPGGVQITFRLKPYRQIKDIRVSGEYPLFTSDVLKAMGVYSGDAMTPDTIPEQERLIADLYRKEGYMDPRVTVRAEQDPEGGFVILDVAIRPGNFYHLDSLTIKGVNAVLDAEIRSRMNSWRVSFYIADAGRFIDNDFASDVKNLQSVFWQRGYPECEIAKNVTKDDSSGKVTAEMTIMQGPYYEISVSGNEWFWDYTLKKEIPVFQEGNRRDRGIKNSIRNIKNRYRQDGFLFAEVEVLEEKVKSKEENVRNLDFQINEGPRTIVESVVFSGNSIYSDQKLTNAIQTGKAPFYDKKILNPDILEEDLASIRALYLRGGYMDVKVEEELTWSKDKSSVSISIKIAEGIQTIVSSLRISGLSAVPEKKAMEALQLKEGKPYRADLIKADEHAISNLISAKGYPYVNVKTDVTFSEDHAQAYVSFHLEEGRKAVMGNIYYRGNFKTRTSAIRRELGIDPGEPFSLKNMLEGQKNIRDMKVFSSVQFRTFGLKEDRDRITLLIDMEEVEPYYFKAAAGYASDRGLYGNTRVGDRNLFGLNKEGWVGGELSQIGYQGQMGVSQQRIFGMPITSTGLLSYEKKEEFNQIFGTSVWTSSITFSREYKPHVTTSLGFRYEWRDQFLQDRSYTIPPGDEESYEPRGALITTPFISYDTRDSFVRPQRGFYSSYALDISKGYQNSLDNFLKHYLNLRFYASPVRRLTFAWLGRMGYIYTFGKNSQIPSDQLLYLGGTMDVRGYDENMLRYDDNDNPVGGRLSITGSMEARIEITRDWETALFLDTGSVRRSLADYGSDSFKSSVGIGLRYVTPIGPMGLLYGHKLNRQDGESPGRYHFSVGYTF